MDLNPTEIGERLRISRENAHVTQADAAAAIGVARTTIVAIEKGQRRIRTDELSQLVKIYGTTINSLLRNEAIHVDLVPRFRKLADSKDEDALMASQLVSDLARAEVELENLLGVRRTHDYPPERPILPGDVRAQAELNAMELRERLGLGSRPVPDIVTLLEMDLGVRVYVRKIPSRISGLFVFQEALGPCMLLNASHPRTRRNQSAAHELGHFISTRNNAEIQYLNENIRSREERYADAFAIAFLTPDRPVRQTFLEVTAGSNQLTRRHVIVLANIFGVSREAMVRRLEDLGLTKRGTWDWFMKNGGITDDQERQVLGDLQIPDPARVEANRPMTLRLQLLAAEAYRQELLSESQLARLLRLDRIELRELFEGIESEASGTDVFS